MACPEASRLDSLRAFLCCSSLPVSALHPLLYFPARTPASQQPAIRGSGYSTTGPHSTSVQCGRLHDRALIYHLSVPLRACVSQFLAGSRQKERVCVRACVPVRVPFVCVSGEPSREVRRTNRPNATEQTKMSWAVEERASKRRRSVLLTSLQIGFVAWPRRSSRHSTTSAVVATTDVVRFGISIATRSWRAWRTYWTARLASTRLRPTASPNHQPRC